MNLKYKELIDFLSSHLKTLEIYIVSNLGYGNSDKRKEQFKKSRIGNHDLYFLPVNQLNAPYKIGQICIEQDLLNACCATSSARREVTFEYCKVIGIISC